jgi:YVTN family beta-propeller protein
VASTPQFVAVEPSGRFAYVALSSVTVEAYAINAGTGALTCIAGGAGEAQGTSPRHIAIDPSGRFAYVANGSSNNITFYTVDQSTGALTLPQVIPIAFTPPDASLPVSIAVHPSGTFAYVTNSGSNSVSVFALDPMTGAPTEIANSPIAVSGGPTSVALEPTGKFAYVANLTGSTVSILVIDQVSGLPALNDTVQLTPSSGPRALTVDPSGKYLYVTLSSMNEVAAFRIDAASGALAQVQGSPYQTGSTPLGLIATGPIQ